MGLLTGILSGSTAFTIILIDLRFETVISLYVSLMIYALGLKINLLKIK